MFALHWLYFAFTVTLTVLPYVHTVCTPGAMILRVAISQYKKSVCSHVSSYWGGYTVEQCQSETCSRGGNTFNHATNGACFIKRCSDGHLELKDATDTRADVYSLFPVCTDAPYVQVKRAAEAVSSNCTDLGGRKTQTVEECRRVTCAAGGNTFNMGENLSNYNCYMKLCTGGSMPLTTKYGGYDVYTLLPCYNNNGGCDHLCHDDGTTVWCTCRSGFTLQSDFKTCQDVNECDNTIICNQTCTNTPGSYTCSCEPGFELAANLRDCFDFNECDSNPCHQTCTNTHGSYTCSCEPGFELAANHRDCFDYCTRQFSRSVSRTSGASSSCPTLRILENVTLDQSMHVACNISSNVINVGDKLHVLKKCANEELELTQKHGGWDVYNRFSQTDSSSAPTTYSSATTSPPYRRLGTTNNSGPGPSFPSWAIGTTVAVVVVVIAVVVIAVMAKRHYSRTRENPVQGKENHATQGPVTATNQGHVMAPGTTRPLPDAPKLDQAQVGGAPSEGVYEDIEEQRASPSMTDKPGQTYYNVHPQKDMLNYDRLNKDEINAPVVNEYDSITM